MKNIIAILLIIYGLLGNSVFDILDTPTPEPVPTPAPAVHVDRPSAELVAIVEPIASLVDDADDRIKLALFSLELAKRVSGYEITLQQFNDIIVGAASDVFGTSMHGKYDGLDEGIAKLITDITTTENHTLTKEECKALSERFEALAWAFIQR